MGQILLTGEEAQKRPSLLGDVIANGAPQHRILFLDRVENRTLRDRGMHIDFQFVLDARQRPQVCGEDHSDHCSVCTSTESTAERSRTIGAQFSPASGDAYTWPPVVPKYTPHESSESTAIASRSTFT